MNKAFIFDMDGVIVDSERAWTTFKEDFNTKAFGKEIAEKIGSTLGISNEEIYEKAIAYGSSMNKDEYQKMYNKYAKIVYKRAKTPKKLTDLIKKLKQQNFKVGLVSASKQEWIDMVLPRLSFSFDYILSLNNHPDLKGKPSPDGYLEAINALGAKPENTIILEDSNPGIQSAKASGAFVIGLRQFLLPGYIQEGADAYADTIGDVLKIIN